MKPSDLVHVSKSVDGKSFRLTAKEDVTHIYMIGHSSGLESSARPNEQVNTIMIQRNHSRRGLVVLRVYSSNRFRDKNSSNKGTDLFLEVPPHNFADLSINVSESFVPSGGLLGQIVWSQNGGYGLRVFIDGKYYTSVTDKDHSDEIHLPDSNLLVSYLNGDTLADAVIAAAEAHVAEVAAFEQLEKCKIQNDGLRRVLGRGEGSKLALCFVHENEAYFTTQDLSCQTGDNWDVVPHTENAGIPHVAPRGPSGPSRGALQWDIVRVTWTGPFNVVTDFEGRSLSAYNINAKKAPWLEGIKNPNEFLGPIVINAGTYLDRFISNITQFGGTVTVEEVL